MVVLPENGNMLFISARHIQSRKYPNEMPKKTIRPKPIPNSQAVQEVRRKRENATIINYFYVLKVQKYNQFGELTRIPSGNASTNNHTQGLK
jgi:hypothetical protein